MHRALHRSLLRRGPIERDDAGFTLVELLIVIVIVGILAAIAVPTFLNQQKAAQDAAAKQDVSNAKLVTVAYLTGGKSTRSFTAPSFADAGFVKSGGTGQFNFRIAEDGAFCVEERSFSRSSAWFSATSASGAITAAVCDRAVYTENVFSIAAG